MIKAEEQLELADYNGCSILSPMDKGYPKLLAATKDDPFLLWVRGSLAPNPEKSVAIIGTRQPTEHGRLIAQRITRYFVEQGWSIVSGLALGCDGVAHQEAVDAGGHTTAVLAHGLHTIAPSKHRKLAEDILDAGGALVSQYPIGRAAIAQQFVQRDKTQAGMAQGVIMIQSDLQGGSLHASRASLDYGRWLAVPYPTDQDLGRNEPKIQANLRLADGSGAEKMDLLRLKGDADLARIIVLRSKDDYSRCLVSKAEPVVNIAAMQGSMF
ncbi:DNA-processing protein DprA [Stenotrophomonas maltophilia]|uniref:DNA-processing protein DprA n=1 Tax=Stenotrophomonas maltophilia TaxID=40324 RepID=UPI0039F6BD9C